MCFLHTKNRDNNGTIVMHHTFFFSNVERYCVHEIYILDIFAIVDFGDHLHL